MPLGRAHLVAALAMFVGCAPLPDTGDEPEGPAAIPPLLPLEVLTDAPPPQATPELADALARRGDALRQEAAAIE